MRKIFEWYASGNYSLTDIRKKVIADGFVYSPSRPKIARSAVEKILKNTFYVGRFTWGGEKFVGIHEPLVSIDLFNKVREVFESHNKPKYRKRFFLYGGLMTCGECGCQITAQRQKGKYVYYVCTNGKGGCANRAYVKEEALHDQFAAILKAVTVAPEVVEWIKTAIKTANAMESKERKEAAAKITGELQRLRDRLAKAHDDKLDGVISDEMWRQRSVQWQDEIDHLEALQRRYTNASKAFYEDSLTILELAAGLYYQYVDLSDERKHKTLKMVLQNCPMSDGKLTPEYRKPYDLFAAGNDPWDGGSGKKRTEKEISAKWSG